jgi:hypothetical protein
LHSDEKRVGAFAFSECGMGTVFRGIVARITLFARYSHTDLVATGLDPVVHADATQARSSSEL